MATAKLNPVVVENDDRDQGKSSKWTVSVHNLAETPVFSVKIEFPYEGGRCYALSPYPEYLDDFTDNTAPILLPGEVLKLQVGLMDPVEDLKYLLEFILPNGRRIENQGGRIRIVGYVRGVYT
ncbi:hypothetical protein CHAN_09490 [Corynebacterium hansenii]|nr:hypothetical protein CHAN_09490 [Corynebacterium hansenii]